MSFLCVQCPKSFSQQYHLNRHIESNHLDKKILCDKCEDSLQRHAISCKTVTGNQHILNLFEVRYECVKDKAMKYFLMLKQFKNLQKTDLGLLKTKHAFKKVNK